MTNDFWTEEKVTILKSMWAEGATASMIANVVGCSRNAVMGKVSRLRLQTADGPASRNIARIYKATTMPKTMRVRRQQAGGNTLGIVAALRRRPIMELPPEIVDNPIAFVDLDGWHCRWPVSGEGLNTMFCGAEKVKDLSYCACHALRAYSDRGRMTREQYQAHIRAYKAKATAA